MPVHIAMLRGINVGGNNRIKMDALRGSLEKASLKQVATYIQSGNVVFDAGKRNAFSLAEKIEQRILNDFGISPLAITRSLDELESIVKANPYLRDKKLDAEKCHVIFLAEPATAAAATELRTSLTAPPDLSHLSKREIYLHLPNGVSQSSLWGNPVERRLLKRSTMRNWKTVTALLAMAQELA